MAFQNHATGVLVDDGMGVSGCVIDKLFHLLHCLFSWAWLLGDNGAKCCEHCWINCLCLIEEGNRDFLDEFLVVWGEKWGSVSDIGVQLLHRILV